ncbi:MAG: aminoglycoside phosphotransferase family protein [Tateyamaria sp.]
MPDREALKSAFLTRTGWDTASRVLVAGDASNRKYERLTAHGETRILMDAPPEKGEDVRPFVEITHHLQAARLSAPTVFAQDENAGFLLIEDFGDDIFARLIAADPAIERPLYEAAVDVLVQLHRYAAPHTLSRYDADKMTQMASLAFDWYQRGATGAVQEQARDAFADAIRAKLVHLDDTPTVLVQRDYHAENLIWLPDRTGPQRVGLLDYQDAMLGHPAYDLVSILKDARRDVSPQIQTDMVERYIDATSVDTVAFKAAYNLMGVQRNLRILGVFARLSLAYGKPHYIDLIPRVWDHVLTSLSGSELSDLTSLIHDTLPAPTPDVLRTLKDKCNTIPLP